MLKALIFPQRSMFNLIRIHLIRNIASSRKAIYYDYNQFCIEIDFSRNWP